MLIAKVIGTTVSTIKEPTLEGRKLLILRQTDIDGKPVTGDQCIQVNISDNGPNDKDPTVGTIVDPAGMAGGGAAGGGIVFTDTRTSDTSGCTVSHSRIPVNRGSEWWLLAGFIAWLGWNRRKRARK